MTDPITRAELLAVISDAHDELAEPAWLIKRLAEYRDRLLRDAPIKDGPFAIETDAGLRIVDSQGRTVG